MADKFNIDELKRRISDCSKLIDIVKSKKLERITLSDKQIEKLNKLVSDRGVQKIVGYLEKVLGPGSGLIHTVIPIKATRTKKTTAKASGKKMNVKKKASKTRKKSAKTNHTKPVKKKVRKAKKLTSKRSAKKAIHPKKTGK
jgi:hypothetical protein